MKRQTKQMNRVFYRRALVPSAVLITAALLVGCATTSSRPKEQPVSGARCETIEACVVYVRESVARQWIRPSNFTYPSKVQLRVKLDDRAAVEQVDVAMSSGNAQFDRSAVEAVERVNELPGLLGLDSNIYEKTFRKFFFDFSPDVKLGPSAGDRQAYEAAFELLKAGNYEESASAFAAFVQKYPSSPLTDYGLYWAGESNYVLRAYGAAKAAFQTVIEKYPNSRKVPDTLLRLGDISYKNKEYDAARSLYERVLRQFASTEPAKLSEQRLAKMRGEGL